MNGLSLSVVLFFLMKYTCTYFPFLIQISHAGHSHDYHGFKNIIPHLPDDNCTDHEKILSLKTLQMRFELVCEMLPNLDMKEFHQGKLWGKKTNKQQIVFLCRLFIF